MRRCFLDGYGACGGKLSREHYVSEVVLRQLSLGKTATIGGLPWQPALKLQDVGLASLQAKILCEVHNSGLSHLDSTAGTLLRTLDAIDKAPTSVEPVTHIPGPSVERWFLKVVCGLVAGQRMAGGAVPDEWKQILTGGTWPNDWGLYAMNEGGPLVLAKDVHITTLVHPVTRLIIAVQFFYGGVCFRLLLGNADAPATLGLRHPAALLFRLPEGERRIDFGWRDFASDAITYTKVGTTSDPAPYLHDWTR